MEYLKYEFIKFEVSSDQDNLWQIKNFRGSWPQFNANWVEFLGALMKTTPFVNPADGGWVVASRRE